MSIGPMVQTGDQNIHNWGGYTHFCGEKGQNSPKNCNENVILSKIAKWFNHLTMLGCIPLFTNAMEQKGAQNIYNCGR